jgi:hypothetical protein
MERRQQTKEPQPEGAVKKESGEAANFSPQNTFDFSFQGFSTVS